MQPETLSAYISAVISNEADAKDRPLAGFKLALLSRGFLLACSNTIVTGTIQQFRRQRRDNNAMVT